MKALPLLALILLACGDDGPQVDANGILRSADGCWADGEQVWEAVYTRYCSSACGGVEPGLEETCLEEALEQQESVRDWWCSDPCAVDACLKKWDHYLETCDPEDGAATDEQCATGPHAVYWDASSSEREWSETCRGW